MRGLGGRPIASRPQSWASCTRATALDASSLGDIIRARLRYQIGERIDQPIDSPVPPCWRTLATSATNARGRISHMPVLGHACVGLAIGAFSQPSTSERSRGITSSSMWLPAVVTLAYLPDIIAQLTLMVGWSDGRFLGHSILFAVAISPVLAVILVWLVDVSFLRAFVTVLV